MGARKKPLGPYLNPQILTEKIQAGTIIGRLKSFINSQYDPRSPHFMAPHQVSAAIALLRKVLPDLAAVEHAGEVQVKQVVEAEPLVVEWKAEFADPPSSSKDTPSVEPNELKH